MRVYGPPLRTREKSSTSDNKCLGCVDHRSIDRSMEPAGKETHSTSRVWCHKATHAHSTSGRMLARSSASSQATSFSLYVDQSGEGSDERRQQREVVLVLVLAICSWATRIRAHHKLLVAADGPFHCCSRSCWGQAIDHHLHLLQPKPK